MASLLFSSKVFKQNQFYLGQDQGAKLGVGAVGGGGDVGRDDARQLHLVRNGRILHHSAVRNGV